MVRHAPPSEPQYEPMYNKNPSLQQDFNRTRHPRQNQNISKINRQIINPRRNRNFTTPRGHFNIPSSPTPISLDLSSTTIQCTIHRYNLANKNTPNVPPDYLGSTPTSEQIRESPFKPPTSKQHLPLWMTQAFTQGKPNLVN